MKELNEKFRCTAAKVSELMGTSWAFLIACTTIIVWAITGPLFHFSDTWQLVINTGTTIITFLMVFLIQNSQNRDAKAMHLKLDEIIRSIQGARNQMVDLEDCTDEELAAIQKEMDAVRRRGGTDSLAEIVSDVTRGDANLTPSRN